MTMCIACAAYLHIECYNWDETKNKCCCYADVEEPDPVPTPEKEDDGGLSLEISEPKEIKSKVSKEAKEPQIPGQLAFKMPRRQKDDSAVRDNESTGRKRAAREYPLEPGMVCEWKGLKFAGGGTNPIVGCNGNPATNRHHGPDKSTLNNDKGNVHRVCVHCHNRWHTNNDRYYPSQRPKGAFIPDGDWETHDPETRATELEIAQSEIYWMTNKPRRVENSE